MILERFPELLNLPAQEKRLLISELCEDLTDSIRQEPDPKIVALLEERWKAYEEDPSGALTLEEFRERMRASFAGTILLV
jgi:putative addiction module component (TIGR02574 family)